MKILYINQYFKTPDEAGSTRSYWIAKELLKNGYDVTMVSHANTERGYYQNKLIEEKMVEGIKLITIRNTYSNNMNTLQRIFSFLKFMFFSTYVVFIEKNVDLVYSSSTPLTVAFPALIRKWFRGTKFIFEVRDLWPEAPIQLGFIKNKWMIKFLRWFEKITYQNAVHIIALSPGMKQGVLKYIKDEKVSMIPNMAKVDKFWLRPIDLSINEKYNLSNDTFKIIYFGTIGLANGMDYLIKSIKALDQQNISGFEFVILGDGAKKKDLFDIKSQLQHVQLTIIDRQPMEIVSKIVNNCDVSICTFSNLPILKTNSPNKLFDSLSAGKISIVNSDGWTKEIVEKYQCGYYVNPDEENDLVQKILFLHSNPDLCKQMGVNAREVAEKYFDKSILCSQINNVVTNIINQ